MATITLDKQLDSEQLLDTLARVITRTHSTLWFAGNRRSDTLAAWCSCPYYMLWFAGNRRSDTLNGTYVTRADRLWFAGNRRSDTLQFSAAPTGGSCGLRGIVARIH